MSVSIPPLPEHVLRTLAPPPRWSVAQWAVEKPFLCVEKGALHRGPYKLDMTPYWREPLDAIGDSRVEKINVVAPPQSGKTKMAEAGVTWYLEHRPTNMLYIRPTEADLTEALRDRWQWTFRENLGHLISNENEWMVLHRNPRIEFIRSIFYAAAATVPRQLTSRTTAFIYYDETDTGGDSDNELGDVLDACQDRQMAVSAAMSLVMGTSSAKYNTGSNWLAYDKESDARRYWEPCPFCGTYQDLTWEKMYTVDGERDPQKIVAGRLARYPCEECGSEIEDSWQGWMVDRGRWVPRGHEIVERLPLNDAEVVERGSLEMLPDAERWEPKRQIPEDWTPNSHRGYQLWAANVKFPKRSWSRMMAAWFRADKSGDPTRRQVVVNSWMSRPWSMSVASAGEATVRGRIGAYEPRVAPARAKLILGAVDVQKDYIWYAFRAFGVEGQSWGIDEGIMEVHRDDFAQTFAMLYERAFKRGWPVKGSPEKRMRAWSLAVDAGYRTDEVYDFARRPGVIAVRGVDVAVYRVRLNQVEGKRQPDPVDLYWLNTRAFKDRLQRDFKRPPDDASAGGSGGASGGWWLHRETTEEMIQHLTAEELRPKKSNQKILVWEPKSEGRPNHYLDCEVYISGLAEILSQRHEVDIFSMREQDPPLGVFNVGSDPIGGASGQETPRRASDPDREPWLGSGDSADKPGWLD